VNKKQLPYVIENIIFPVHFGITGIYYRILEVISLTKLGKR
jgi:hypothetical protein